MKLLFIRSKMMVWTITLLGMLVLAFDLTVASAQSPAPTATEFDSVTLAQISRINESGSMIAFPVFVGDVPPTPPLFYRAPNGDITRIPLQGDSFFPTSLNERGIVAGQYGSGETSLAATWSLEGGYSFVPLPPGYFKGAAIDVNNRGDILFHAQRRSDNRDSSFIFSPAGGSLTELPCPADAQACIASDMNERGWIVGTQRSLQNVEVLVWDSPTRLPYKLPTPPGIEVQSSLPWFPAGLINESNTIVINFYIDGGRNVGFLLWRPGDNTPRMYIDSQANGLNNRDVVAGMHFLFSGAGARRFARLWNAQSDTVVDLLGLGRDVYESAAFDINDDGTVVGAVYDATGQHNVTWHSAAF